MWYGCKEYFSVIESIDYSQNIYSKTDDAAGFHPLKKVIKIENLPKIGAVVWNICWEK
jgi:hypothetical protein